MLNYSELRAAVEPFRADWSARWYFYRVNNLVQTTEKRADDEDDDDESRLMWLERVCLQQRLRNAAAGR